jgi:hypothetical protein
MTDRNIKIDSYTSWSVLTQEQLFELHEAIKEQKS